MARKFKELFERMPSRAQAEVKARARKILAEMALDELREARKLTQEQLAARFKVGQPAIAKLEKRTDMYLSTLRGVIQAMGGELEIRAVFSDGDVRINQLKDLRRAKVSARR
ncbi:MAG TPA: XRE family transcriptional regulator [Candidatus Acidoferrales bacterium]